jgi:hypothetical protein
VRPSGSSGAFAALFFVLVLSGALTSCKSSCSQACEKLLSCQEIENSRVSEDECESSCNAQESQYEVWDDVEKQDRFDQERQCIVDSTCADIADGACYDDELFPFDQAQ